MNRWVRRGALFALTAWPVWVVSVPPLQDLPQHLAAAYVQLHPADYPEYVSNGFLKTNSTLFLFLHLVGRVVSLRVAAKLFVSLVLLAGAIVYPLAAGRLGSHERAATYFAWPLVHNWFVAMGMLDFALSVPLALLTLVAISAFRQEPTPRRFVVACGLGLLTWYTHAFSVAMLAMLALVEALWRWRRWRVAWRLVAPLVPATALAIHSARIHRADAWPGLHVPHSPWGAFFGESLSVMSKWTFYPIVLVVIAWCGLSAFRVCASPRFFSPLALVALLALYLVLPYHDSDWFYISSRVLPFFFFGCALRMPKLGRWGEIPLTVLFVVYSAGLGRDYVRAARDVDAVVAAEAVMPRGASVAPMVFDGRGTVGASTEPLYHVWAYAMVDRGAHAPLLFDHSRSFPVRRVGLRPYGRAADETWAAQFAASLFWCARGYAGDVAACARRHAVVLRFALEDAAVRRYDYVLMVGVTREMREALDGADVVYDDGRNVVLVPARRTF